MDINIKFKSLEGKITEVMLKNDDVISSKLDQLKDLFNVSDEQNIRLIYAGAILDFNKSFADYNIQNNDFIVVMVSKKQKPPAPVASTPVSSPPVASTLAPAPPPAAVSTTEPVLAGWTSNPTDSEHLYSIEQIHAIQPLLMQVVIENPVFMMTLLTNPQQLGAMIAGQGFRPIIRQLMQQSQGIVDVIRSGNGSVAIGMNLSMQPTTGANPFTNTTASASIVNTNSHGADDDYDTDDTGDTGYDDESSDMTNPVSQLEQIITNFASSIPLAPTSSSQETLTDDDMEKINGLVTMLNVSVEMAKSAYLQSGKNADLAATLLMEMMF